MLLWGIVLLAIRCCGVFPEKVPEAFSRSSRACGKDSHKFVEVCFLWKGPQDGGGEECEEGGVAETMWGELNHNSPSHPSVLFWARESVISEGR